jgi:diacylglycerol kinase family enzyme
MYSYIYDSYLNSPKYEKILAKIEQMILNLGLKGHKNRATVLNSLRGIVKEQLKKNVKTIVILGNDTSLSQILDILSDNPNIIVGFIPIGSENNQISKLLGIPLEMEACNTLSCRIIKPVSLSKANENLFIRNLKINSDDVKLFCNNQFTIYPEGANSEIVIYNYYDNLKKRFDFKNTDIVLTIKSLIYKKILPFKKSDSKSIIPLNKIYITSSKEQNIIIDNQKTIKTPCLVEKCPNKIQFIVGKKRKIN